MGEVKIVVKGVNDRYVVMALADLAGFPEGSTIGRVPSYHPEINSESLVCFHKESLAQAHDDFSHPMFYPGPDFSVTQIYRPPRQDDLWVDYSRWMPADEYLIEGNNRIANVDLSLLPEKAREFQLRPVC